MGIKKPGSSRDPVCSMEGEKENRPLRGHGRAENKIPANCLK
jgi:hypothetical protein